MATTPDGPRPVPDEKALRAGVLDLLAQRDPDKTICPSEVARQLGGTSWRDLMSPVRDAAEQLVREGLVEIVQGGTPVELRLARGPVRLRRGPSWPAQSVAIIHWLLPVDPAAHPEHLPADWRERSDAGPVWAAIGRSQPLDRWCLRTGYRTMRAGDLVWAHLSRRQELCAVGSVREVVHEDGDWFLLVDWDTARTAELCRDPLPRSAFGQIPMSTCRARAAAIPVLTAKYAATACVEKL